MNRFAAEPYPGARPFQRRDRDRSFGRAVEAGTLVDMWRVNHLTILSGSTLFGSAETRRRTYGLMFLRELSDALRSLRVHVLVSVREPAVDQLTAQLGAAARYQPTPLSLSQAYDAVVKPVARKTRRSYLTGPLRSWSST